MSESLKQKPAILLDEGYGSLGQDIDKTGIESTSATDLSISLICVI